MQRINWFPDPNITGTVKPVASDKMKVECPVVVDNRNWLRATSTATGENYAQYLLVGSQIPPAGSYHVHANAYAQRAQAGFQIFYHINGSYQQPFNAAVGDGQTVVVDRTITPSGRLRSDSRPHATGFHNGRRDRHDERYSHRTRRHLRHCRWGASGLLHRGYDAVRIGASVGRVMPDDGDELAQASERGHRIGRMERCDRHRERRRDENLLHRQRRIALPLSEHERGQDHTVLVRRCRPIPGGACGSGGTCHCRAAQWGEGRYLGIQHHPSRGGGKYDVSGFLSGKGLSDPDRVGDLHVRRLGEIAVNGSDVVRRGYDAARLTLMGVMA